MDGSENPIKEQVKKIRKYEYQKYGPSRKGRMGKGTKRKEIQ